MYKGYVNWKLFLVLVLGLCAVGVTLVGLRKFNRTQRSEQGLKKGLAAYDEKRWSEAAAGLGQYLAVHQTDIDILLKYGHAQTRIQPFKHASYSQAVNAYRNVLRMDEVNLDAARSLVDLYLQARVFGEAELVASRFLEKQDDTELTLRLATAQILQRKYEQAAELLTALLATDTSETGIYELLATIARERPELLPKSPREWIDAAVEANPQKAEAHILRARFLTSAGQGDQAIESLQQAMRCDLSDVQVRLSLAASWLRLDAIEQAESHLDMIQAEDPSLSELWQLRAIAAAKRQDPVYSAKVAREGLEHLGAASTAFLPYAVELFLQAQENDSARKAMQSLRDSDISSGLVRYLDGLLAERDGDWSRAVEQWREAVVQGYTSEPVYLKLAEGALRLDDRTSAIETLRRFINQNPNSFSAQMMLSRILSEVRQWSEASQYAAAAVRLNPESQEAQSLLARIRIELSAAQPQSQARVDQQMAELIARDDSQQNRLLAFRIALSRQDWAGAQQTLDILKAREGGTLPILLAQAEYYTRRGQQDQAATLLDAAIQEFPAASEPVIMRASLFVEEDRVSQAVSFLREAAGRLDGMDQRKVQLWLGDLYRRNDDVQAAEALYAAMAAANPQDILPRRQLLALRRADAGAELLQKWIDEIKQIEGQGGRLWKVEQVQLWAVKGEMEQRYTQAVTMLNENLNAYPDDKQSLMLLAGAHEQAGNERLAVSLLRETLARHPEDIDLALAAMGALYRAEEFRQAEQLLTDLLAAGHADPRLAQLELQSHIRQGRLDSAEDMLEKMVLGNAQDGGAKMSLAMLRTRNGQFDTAKTLIDELITADPDSVVSHAVLVDWHLRQDQPEKAIAVCDALLQRVDTVQSQRLRCQVLLAVNENEQAIEAIGHLLERSGQDAEGLLIVSDLYVSAGLAEQALSAASKALALEPDSFEAQKKTALLLLSRPQPHQEGMELLDKALARQPRDAQLRLRKASLMLGEGAAAEGIQMLNALVNEFPRLEPAWGYLIEWYLLNTQPGMAMDTALRGLAAMPDNRLLLISKARIEALRSPSVALETLNRLAVNYPADGSVVEMQVRLMQRMGRAGDGAKRLGEWLESNPALRSSALTLLQMELLYQSGNRPQATQIYEQLMTDPETAATAMVRWIGLVAETADADTVLAVFQRWYDTSEQGAAAAMQVLQVLLAKQTAETVSAAEKILRLVETREPDSAEIAYGMAMLRHMTGRKMESIPFYERTLALQPDNLVAVNNLAWILSQDAGEHEKALRLAERGLAQAPNYVDLIDTRGMIYFSLGRYEQATADFRMAADRYLDSQPQKAVSVYYLAQSLFHLGRNDQAMAEFYRARELDESTGGLSADKRRELAEKLRQ